MGKKRRAVLVGTMAAVMMLGGTSYISPAHAEFECREGSQLVVWTPNLKPDRNGNGVVCERFSGKSGTPRYQDDR